MPFQIDRTSLVLLLAVAVLALGILAYAVKQRLAARREQRSIKSINNAIIEYFRRSGVQVSASCARLSAGNHFTAVVESEPMKRFRLSHIIEMTLRDHVRKTCGLELDKVYWRFPIRDAQGAAEGVANGAKQPAEGTDDYINEGLEHYRYIPKVEATELPWEHFEQVVTISGQDRNGPDAPPRNG